MSPLQSLQSNSTYTVMIPDKETKDCPVCFEPFPDKPDESQNDLVVAHPGDGIKHPLCFKCAEKLIESSDHCPTCRTLIKTDNFMRNKQQEWENDFQEVPQGILIAISAIVLIAAEMVFPYWTFEASFPPSS